MQKSYRIKTEIGGKDKVLKVNLKQGIDTFKILSLEINPEDDYEKHTSDYGCIVGRVLANNSFGVPNVKISVFVPIESGDENIESIEQTYPYKTVNSTNTDGIAYNLLQDKDYSGIDGLHKSIGTFPNKQEILDNDEECVIYDKYWTYSTVSNESGDFMIFGVPTGSCQVHYDCDLSDIGMISQRPYDLINKGYDVNLFKNAVEFKDTDNPSTAPYVLSQNATVYVYPFWGDDDKNKIGITRHDIDIDYEFTPTCIFMGSSITDSPGTYFDVNGVPVGANGRFKSLTTSRGNIEIIRYTEDGVIEEYSEEKTNVIDDNGVWCYQIPMNLDRIYTDEEGNIKPTKIPGKGIPTRTRVRFRISLTNVDVNSNGEHTAKMLVPCTAKMQWSGNNIKLHYDYTDSENTYYEFGSNTPDIAFRDLYWGKVYSIKEYLPRIEYDSDKDGLPHKRCNSEEDYTDYSQYPIYFSYPFSCISSIDFLADSNPFPYTTMYAGAENWNDEKTRAWFRSNLSELASTSSYSEKGLHFCFENDWINGCLYFPKIKIVKNDDNSYNYFGKNNSYKFIYYTGRHNCKINNKEFTTRQPYTFKWLPMDVGNSAGNTIDQDNTSIFSHVTLPCGVVESAITNDNKTIFYYRRGVNTASQYYILYATDIILLGNIVDIYDSLPSLYKELPSTTATFPPIAPPRTCTEAGMNMDGYTEQLDTIYHEGGIDGDDVDMFGNWYLFDDIGNAESGIYPYDSDISHIGNYTSNTATDECRALFYNCIDSSPTIIRNGSSTKSLVDALRYVQERTSLFFGYKCAGIQDFLHYMTPSFVNTSRICELDVINDHAYRDRNGDVIPVNGLIDKNDIINNDNRSNFASMNFDITKSYKDPFTGYKRFLPYSLYMTDFDGRLQKYLARRPNSTVSEDADPCYVEFRYGVWQTQPMKYVCSGDITRDGEWVIENNDDLPLPVNSLYFYFGLRSGASAIDKFNDTYGMPQSTSEKEKEEEAIKLLVSNLSTCLNGQTIHDAYFYLSSSLSYPVNFTLYRGASEVYNQNTTTSTIHIDELIAGVYKIKIEDAYGNIYTKRFGVTDTLTSCTPIVGSDDDYNYVSFSQIDNIAVSNFYYVVVDSKTVYWEYNTKKYYFQFEEEMSNVTVGSTVTRMPFNKTISLLKTEVWVNYNKQDCTKSSIYIQLQDETSNSKLFCNVSTDLFIPWQGTYLVWDSKETMNAGSPSYNFLYDSSDDAEERQLACVSSMMSCVYDEEPMTLQYNNSNYITSIIYPNTSTFLAQSKINNYVNYTSSSSSDAYQIQTTHGAVNDNIYMPHIVGQNFPNGYKIKTKFKYGTFGGYKNNPLYKLNDEEFLGYYYFGLLNTTDHSKDLPKANVIPSTAAYQYGYWKDDDIKNMVKVQTVDRRLDYDIMIKTPVVFIGDYNNFANLKNKSIIKGNVDGYFYGGLRMDYDSSYNLTSYDFSLGYLSGEPSKNAALYSECFYEDTANISTTGTYYSGSLSKGTNSIINDAAKNDCIEVKGDLSGSSSFNFGLISCSPYFHNKIVKPGKSIVGTISYDAGIEFIHTSIEDDNWDIIYKGDSASDNTATTLKASLSGSSLSFRVKADSNYVGSTYTMINTESDNETDLTDAQYTFNDNDNKPYIHVIRHEGSKTSNIEVVRTIENANNSYKDVKFDNNTSAYATYIDNFGNRLIAKDSIASLYFTFKLTDGAKNITFTDTDYLTIPIYKRYDENETTLLKQAFVINQGYAYYASSINISHNSDRTEYTVQLYSPILSNGSINYKTTSLTTRYGQAHTIGEIAQCYCPTGTVTYDKDSAKFTINISETGTHPVMYFIMTNGLKYKIDTNV